MTADRDKFEIYAANQGLRDFERNEFDDYRNPFTQQPWCFWKASRDALAQAPAEGDELPPLPERDGDWAGDDWFTADTLREYARAALASKAQPKHTANELTDEQIIQAGRHHPSNMPAWGIGSTRQGYLEACRAVIAADRALQAPAPAPRGGLVEWLPIETAPHDGTEVLIGRDGLPEGVMSYPHEKGYVKLATWRRGGGDSVQWDVDPLAPPTHWARLPSFPKNASPAVGAGWQPIETAPKDQRIVLADRTRVSFGQWAGRYFAWGYIDEPTHWMSLPHVPVQHKGEGNG